MTSDRYVEAARTVFRGEPVVAAYLFGSRARGDHREDSDVDVAVLLEGGVEPAEYLTRCLRYAAGLEHQLHAPVPPPVVLNDAPLRLQHRVLRDGRLLHVGDERARVAYEARTRTVAGDFELKARELDRLLLAAHAQGTR